MLDLCIRLKTPDPDVLETNYSYDILMDGYLIVQVRKKYLGDAVAKALAEAIREDMANPSKRSGG